uniref:Uncharacterized protein n=1 Tax=Nothoprocta perdicaria TaxID=30464 RepID=A0A8C6Z4D6_NOTPE
AILTPQNTRVLGASQKCYLCLNDTILMWDFQIMLSMFYKRSPERKPSQAMPINRAPHACRAARRAELRAVRDAVGSAVGAALRLYEERAGELGLAVALRRGPRCPALAEALEGLHDVERHYRLLYLESSLLLQRISCDDLDTMEALPQAWECILERHKPHVVQGSARAGTSLFKGGLEHGLCERCPCSEQAALFTWCDK